MKQQEKNFKQCRDSDLPNLFSACQLDLIKRMIEEDHDKRISVNDALKHAWFINVREKLKQQKVKSINLKLPSLKTIIEMVEQTEQDTKRKSQQHSIIYKTTNKLECATSIQQFDFSNFQSQQDVSPLVKSLESQNEIFYEDHQISNLIFQLNNKQYQMMPSLLSHFIQDKNQYRLDQPKRTKQHSYKTDQFRY